MTQQTFVYIPYWIESVLNRNSVSLSTCLDYSKLRQYLSLEDMSGFLALQGINSLTREEGKFNNGTLFSMWSNSVADTQRAEFTQAVIPMSRSTELELDILKRLEPQEDYAPCLVSGVEQQSEPVFYKIVDSGGAVNLVVLYRGFLAYITAPNNEYTFVVDQLKVFYVYLKAYQVSPMPLFRKYLHLLCCRINSA